ncbi:uncharacterized protein LOC127702453 [Mytilus californianus]|uniref:uncharacterized protein LOC127702453 n=1 Tax=Mytilus californianus TaxID=6549 RepID=UPI002247290B|nr:uncharacterized protein LOC127702453 [Mytilus californianus]
MDELEDTSVAFKPRRQVTSNISAGSASEDGDYKALNAKRKLLAGNRQSFDITIIEDSETPTENAPHTPSLIRKSSILDTQYEEFRNKLFHSVTTGNVGEVSQSLTSLPAAVSVADDYLREPVTDKNILHVALENKHSELAKHIIENCTVDILKQRYKGEKDYKTALHLITESNDYGLAKLLLEKLRTKEAKIDAIKAETTVEVVGQRPRSLSSFHLAAFLGLTGLVRLYVETGMDINFRNSKRDTALLWASRWGHLETVSYLLDLKADCMLENDKNSTALHWAVRYEHIDVVRFLLTKGKADANKERLQGLVVPIVLAAALGNVRITEILLENGANPNHMIRSGETPLHVASKEGNASVIDVLIHHKADVDRQDDNGNTPLINAAANDHIKCIDLLMKAGADATVKNHMGYDSWHFALQSENDEVLQIVCKHARNFKIPHLTAAKLGRDHKINVLFKSGFNIKEVDDDNNSLVHYASCFDQHHVIAEFHSKVDINRVNKKGNTALHIACLKGHIQSIQALIDVKAKADIENKDGQIALHVAATSPNTTPEIAKILVEYTIKSHAWECLNSVDKNRDNALHLAAENAQPDVLWEFRFVRFKDVDHKGHTPLHDAVRKGHPEVLETMLDIFESMQRDADINTPNSRKETVLHFVASEGFQQSVSRIIFLGGDLAAQDINGNTVLHRLVLESTIRANCNSNPIEMLDTVLNSVVRWWCMRNGCQIPNQADDNYLKYRRDALFHLLYDVKNEKRLCVLGLACYQAAHGILSELMRIEGVTSFREENSTLYDVTYFTPKTGLSQKKPLFGRLSQVDQSPATLPDSARKVSRGSKKSKFFLQKLVTHPDKQNSARVLDIPPLKKMEEMFKTICMVTYLTMMALHIVYMSVFSYASITALGILRNNTDVPHTDLILVYIWVPLEPLVFLLYISISVVRTIKRGDRLKSLSWKVIIIFLIFSILTIIWVILIGVRNKNNDYVLAVVLCFGWLSTVAFTGGIKGIHYFWRMLKNMIVRDIFRFVVFYAIVLFAFSFAFHAVFQISQTIVDTYPTPGDTLFMVFNLMIGMAELFDDVYQNGMESVGRSTTYSKVLYMFYIVLSTIILLNLLIAMMNDSYSSILAQERVIWRIDAVDIGMKLEKTVPWLTDPFKWLHKRTVGEETPDNISERWYVQVIDGEMETMEKKHETSMAEYIKIELDQQVKSIDKRVTGLAKNVKETHRKLEETACKLDKIIDYFSRKKEKKERKKKKQADS